MHSSDSTKHDKRKALLAILLFLAVVFVLSEVIFWPYTRIWSNDNGYDTLFVGASRTYKGIRPLVVDEQLGCKSYLMASDSCSTEDRYYLVKSAAESETLKTVVLEISYDALIEKTVDDAYIFEIDPMSKLDGIAQRVKFGITRFDFWNDDYDNVYPTLMSFGVNAWADYLKHRDARGFVPYGTVDVSIDRTEAEKTRDSSTINSDYSEEKAGWVDKTIELCQSKGIEVILINTPDSEVKIWQATGWEAYQEYMQSLVQRYGLKFYDFNLYKDRRAVLDDSSCFNDTTHLSEDGSVQFSKMLSQVMEMSSEGADTSQLFYSDYEEAQDNCIYAGHN